MKYIHLLIVGILWIHLCVGEVIPLDFLTGVEYQLSLYPYAFEKDRYSGIDGLNQWLNENLENSSLVNQPEMKIKLSKTKSYSRNVTFYSTNFEHVLKYRITFDSDSKAQNDVIWKIRDITPGMNDSNFKASPEFQDEWSYKIEKNYHCDDGTISNGYSSYVKLPMDATVNIQTVADVNYYFPDFGVYYGLDDNVVLQKEDFVEYVSELKCSIGENQDDCKFTTQLRYDSEDAYMYQESPG